ncbi:S1 family peptidase [Rheinheimera sp. UJ63]|uniref:S1 family peptidase n=1 Tax=Rheinheimera sp. UJ63 TaxID=2910157 RepID=UPI001F2E248A|nr:serine protease [Rheinheimera sp. UJ63]MCF4007819.1 serine protease [Rheinheimera sp. UJ63]
MRAFFSFLLILISVSPLTAHQNDLQATLSKIKPSIVAIGIYNPTAAPRTKLIGTGFVIQPGNQVVTNYHVIAGLLDSQKQEHYVVLSGQGTEVKQHKVLTQKKSIAHDLAILTIADSLPSLTLVKQNTLIADGTDIAFTGFPITQVLGLYPATHRGIVAAHTPIAIPADNSAQLHAAAIRRLNEPFLVYQLDAMAYPGNSGSPLFLPESGEVIGIINSVHIKSTREAVLSDPSAISYAIPVRYLKLLQVETP